MKNILSKLGAGIETIGGFVLGFCGVLVALCLIVWAFEALQKAVS